MAREFLLANIQSKVILDLPENTSDVGKAGNVGGQRIPKASKQFVKPEDVSIRLG